MREFDEVIGIYCSNKDISYTRYSDDLTFSGDFKPSEVINIVKLELKKYRLKLNYDKISIIHHNKRQTVTGIVVNEKINIKREYFKKIRQEIYYITKFGIDEHLDKLNISNKTKYLDSLLGRINYVIQITDNKEFITYKNFLKDQLNIN